jgi:ribosomal-protein-alanine N-acetyltransferase
LYVAPAYRGRGVGKAGVESAVGMARAAGCGAVMLELDVRNERARGLYVGAGFVPQGRDVLSRRV